MQGNSVIFTGAVALIFALVHVFAGRLRFVDVIPRSVWLSFAGGISVAYVFVHTLPELAERQQAFSEAETPLINALEHHIYLLALIGLAVFYALERLVRTERKARPAEGQEEADGVFAIHIASFALYNALIGYLLIHREEDDLRGLLLYGVALAVHFVVNDHALREHHQKLYHNTGRWILAAGVLVGWALGIAFEVSELMVATLFSFLAGGVILNVMKEELPEDRESRVWAFAAGATFYAVILLLV